MPEQSTTGYRPRMRRAEPLSNAFSMVGALCVGFVALSAFAAATFGLYLIAAAIFSLPAAGIAKAERDTNAMHDTLATRAD